jgi:fibronectin type 3 domain-containing protein
MNVVITWDAVVGASYYNIYRSDSLYLIGSKINNTEVTGLTYTDVKTAENKYYYYRVSSVDEFESESFPSEAVRVWVGLSQDITPQQAKIVKIEERGN